VSFIKVIGYAHVKTDVRGQLLTRGHRGLLSVTPDYSAAKYPFDTEGVKILYEAYSEWRLAGTTWLSYDALEQMPKFKIITHVWSGCKTPLSPVNLPIYNRKWLTLSPNRNLLKKEILYGLSSDSVIMAAVPLPSSYA